MTNKKENSVGEQEMLAQSVVKLATAAKKKIVVMESCTGGALASALTDIAGSSAVFEQGFVTYSNRAKADCGVREALCGREFPYTQETADQMAHQALRRSLSTDVGVGITGSLTRPDPSNESSSILGRVHIAVETSSGVSRKVVELEDGGSRAGDKSRVVAAALRLLIDVLRPQEGE